MIQQCNSHLSHVDFPYCHRQEQALVLHLILKIACMNKTPTVAGHRYFIALKIEVCITDAWWNFVVYMRCNQDFLTYFRCLIKRTRRRNTRFRTNESWRIIDSPFNCYCSQFISLWAETQDGVCVGTYGRTSMAETFIADRANTTVAKGSYFDGSCRINDRFGSKYMAWIRKFFTANIAAHSWTPIFAVKRFSFSRASDVWPI